MIEGEADLGFVEGEVEEPLLTRTRVGSDRLVILAAPSHPLALAARVGLDDLAQAAWVGREPGSGTRSEFEHALADLGLPPERLNRMLELPSNPAILAAVAAGGTLAAVSELAARPMIETVRLRRLAFDLPARSFELLTHTQRRRSRASAAFVDELAAGAFGFEA